jgi:hypothetical protein
MGSSANAAVGMATAPTDSSDTINARIIIVYLPKNTAVMAQPITPDNIA